MLSLLFQGVYLQQSTYERRSTSNTTQINNCTGAAIYADKRSLVYGPDTITFDGNGFDLISWDTYWDHGNINSNLIIDVSVSGYKHELTFTGNSAVTFTGWKDSPEDEKVTLKSVNGDSFTVSIASKTLALTAGTDIVVVTTNDGGSNVAAGLAQADIYA